MAVVVRVEEDPRQPSTTHLVALVALLLACLAACVVALATLALAIAVWTLL